jgi:hypothetical protein
METINMILSALNLKDSNSSFELINNNDDIIDYYNFKIKNEKSIKEQIDLFNESINVPLEIFKKTEGCDLSLHESINTLNYILSRKEIMNGIDKNISIYNNFKNIIEILFSRIISIYLEYCNKTNDIIEKCSINVNIYHYSLYYKNIFNDTLNKSFENYYKSLIYRSFNIATNFGCIISWLTFAKLAPEMIKDHCYPIINKDTIIFKNIIWKNIKENKLFEKELELYNKYHSIFNETNSN